MGFHHVAQAGLKLLGSRNPPAPASGSPTRFCHVDQAGLKLLASCDPPALASQSPEITGMSHHTQPHGPTKGRHWMHDLASPASASRVAGTQAPPPRPANFCTLVETGFHRVGQDVLEYSFATALDRKMKREMEKEEEEEEKEKKRKKKKRWQQRRRKKERGRGASGKEGGRGKSNQNSSNNNQCMDIHLNNWERRDKENQG
ncbi:hypothetical protein AAY473_012742 [Plecturocebus cupreus]